MRLDDVAPRTLLLAVVAGWALTAWALALAGMGQALPQAQPGAIAQSVPGLPPATGPVIGPLGQYAGTATRPLFAVDRRPHPFIIQAEGGSAPKVQEFDLVLTSVLITPQAQLALVQRPDGSEAMRVRVGEAPESHPNWRLLSIAPRRATFQGPGGLKTLELRVWGDKGPQAGGPALPANPTAGMPVPVPPVAQPTAPPATDDSAPDAAQIDLIRQRIEARREQMRQNAKSSNPPATVVPPPTP